MNAADGPRCLNAMKILITGASGFIGHHLVKRLSLSQEVFALIHGRSVDLPGGSVSIIPSDLAGFLDTGALPEHIDVIIHLAQANTAFPEAANELFAVNTRAAQRLLDYGRRAGARQFILASSGDVYGRRSGPCRESDAAVPKSFYAATKYAAELLAQSYSDYLQPCILRLFQPYGPGQRNRLVSKLADRMRRGDTVQLHKDDHPRMTPIYLSDLIHVIEGAVDSNYAGVMNVAGDRTVSMRELAVEIGKVVGQTPVFEETGEESGDAIGDNALMKKVFGQWPMVTLEEGLSLMLNSGEEAGCLTHV